MNTSTTARAGERGLCSSTASICEALLGEHRHPAGEHGPHQGLLGAEVVVGGGDVAVGLGVDRPERHAVDPTLADQLLGGVEQPLLDGLRRGRRAGHAGDDSSITRLNQVIDMRTLRRGSPLLAPLGCVPALGDVDRLAHDLVAPKLVDADAEARGDRRRS